MAGDKILMSFTRKEAEMIRRAFFSRFDTLADDQSPPAREVKLAERITSEMEWKWGVKYQQKYR